MFWLCTKGQDLLCLCWQHLNENLNRNGLDLQHLNRITFLSGCGTEGLNVGISQTGQSDGRVTGFRQPGATWVLCGPGSVLKLSFTCLARSHCRNDAIETHSKSLRGSEVITVSADSPSDLTAETGERKEKASEGQSSRWYASLRLIKRATHCSGWTAAELSYTIR